MNSMYPAFDGAMDKNDWNGQLVVAFGDAAVDPEIPGEHVVRCDARDAASGKAAINEADPQRMQQGLVFVLPDSLEDVDAPLIQSVQKAYIYEHFKYVHCPRQSLATDDPLDVKAEKLPDVVHNISQLKNYPWLMTSPLSDKLAARRLGLPVMILLPGPSLRDVLPRLKEIRKHCLIICIARTVRQCIDAGVMPDFVIQLDTYQIQRNYYTDLPEMPETVLVPLSICPFFSYAHKFRGLVMMDSFDLGLLPNPVRIRESFISSITACFGLAESLFAPHAYVAGANLSFKGAPGITLPDREDGPQPIRNRNKLYATTTRDGEPCIAYDYFIATATESDRFAREIAGTSGTRFHSTTDTTLLSREWFPHADVDTITSLPAIDRNAYQETMDTVLQCRETLDITKIRMHLTKQLGEIRQIEQAYTGGAVPREVLEDHVLTRAVKRLRNPTLGYGVDAVGVTARLMTQWRMWLNNARLFLVAMTQASRSNPVSLLCTPEELPALEATLTAMLPGIELTPHCIGREYDPPCAGLRRVGLHGAMSWLATQRLVLVSPRTMQDFSFIFDCAPDENIYDLRLIVGQDLKAV